jgi:hypothetical protein
MGRQMRFYLLPQETSELVASLRSEIGLDCYSANSLDPLPQLDAHIFSSLPAECFGGLRCYPRAYLAPPISLSPAILTHEVRATWHVDISSEVIEFDSCAFDANHLVEGRMYYQHDRLSGNNIVPKNPDFVRWAERVFRSAKRKLHWSKELLAYVGTETELWRQQGGTFLQRAPSNPIQGPALTEYVA